METYDGRGKSWVGWGCVVMLCGGVVVAASSLSMVAIGFGIVVVGEVVVIASSL